MKWERKIGVVKAREAKRWSHDQNKKYKLKKIIVIKAENGGPHVIYIVIDNVVSSSQNHLYFYIFTIGQIKRPSIHCGGGVGLGWVGLPKII